MIYKRYKSNRMRQFGNKTINQAILAQRRMPALRRASKRGRANRGGFLGSLLSITREQTIYIKQTLCQQK